MNRIRPRTSSGHSSLLIMVLVLSLLFVQAIGLLHAVTHAGWQENAAATSSPHTGNASLKSFSDARPDSRLFDARHSCSSFDGATLAAALHVPVYALMLALPVGAMPFWAPFTTRSAPFSCHFSSRAPPSHYVD